MEKVLKSDKFKIVLYFSILYFLFSFSFCYNLGKSHDMVISVKRSIPGLIPMIVFFVASIIAFINKKNKINSDYLFF